MPKFILINKPKDWTSHDVVSYIRKIVREKETGLPGPSSLKLRRVNSTRRAKVGHAGTLDPFATGLLILGIERDATKRLDEFKKLPKTYIATIKLGATSDTQDSTGNITDHPQPLLTKEGGSNSPPAKGELEGVLQSFVGKIEQIPPMFSAKKIKGKKMYELARKGIEVERKPNEIEIFEIKLLEYKYPMVKIEVKCGAGTYIRTLAHDIGQKLNTGAHCDELERTEIGDYSIKDAVAPKDLNTENIENYVFKKAD